VQRALAPRTVFAVAVGVMAAGGRLRPLARELADAGGFAVGALGGTALYVGSVVLAGGSAGGPRRCVDELTRSLGRDRPEPRRLAELGARALYEEAFWRGTLQPLAGGRTPATVAATAGFVARHAYLDWINDRPLRGRSLAELTAFSLVLGTAYGRTNRLAGAVGAHWVRNVLLDARCLAAQPSPAASATATGAASGPRTSTDT
jgi:hypothetical protein